ncbi:hypothetical protein N7461_004194 [Penicillium sp. DV-2018c]|nr:hypothetical protein N7461_004194 [Penicillium sp. DV-2018c]
MRFADIRDNALHRILIDRYASIPLRKIAAPVVCQFDDLTHEFRPLHKLRQPPHVAPNANLSTIRDWKNYNFSEIGHAVYYHNVKIDQHLGDKSEISGEKDHAQPLDLSAVHADDVYEWVSGDTGKGNGSPKNRLGVPPADESTSHGVVMVKPGPEEPREVSQHQPAGIVRYVDLQRDESTVEATKVQRDLSRQRGKKLLSVPTPAKSATTWAKLCHRARKLEKQIAVGSSPTTGQQKDPISIIRSNPGSESLEGASGTAGSGPDISGEDQEPITLLHQPIHLTPGDVGGQLVSPPEVKYLQMDTERRGRSVETVMEDLMLRIENNTSPSGAKMDAPSRQKTRDPSPLIDLECDVNISDSGIHQMVGLDQPALVPSNVLGQSADTQVDQIQRSKTPASDKVDTLFDLPSLGGPMSRPRLNGQSQSLQETLGSSDHHESTPAPVASDLAAVVPSSPDSNHLGSPYEVVRFSDEELRQEEPDSGEHSRSFAKEYLLRYIKDHSGQETSNASENLLAFDASRHGTTFQGLSASLSESNQSSSQQQQPSLQVHEEEPPVYASQTDNAPQCVSTRLLDSDLVCTQQQRPSHQTYESLSALDAGQDDSALQALSPALAGNITKGEQQRRSSHQVHGKVPVLRADLIDISPQSLASHVSRRLLQHSACNITKQGTDPKGGERLAAMDETQTRDLCKTMYHQRPSEGVPRIASEAEETADHKAGVRAWTRRLKASVNHSSKGPTSKPIMPEPSNGWPEQRQSRKEQPTKAHPSTMVAISESSNETRLIRESKNTLFYFLEPILDAVRSFPGPLSLEIQFGLMFMPTVPASTEKREMDYKQLHRFFFPFHGMAPPISMFERLTSSPADIDYLVDLKVNQRQLFDQSYSHRGVKYEFRCRTGSDKLIIVSVNETGSAMIRYPELPLGMVHLNFPSQVWDAAARIQGSIEYGSGDDPEVEGAALAMVKSIRIEPNNEQLRMLVQFPRSSNLRVEQVFMERWSRHPYFSQTSGDLSLQITEFQELSVTPSVLDSGTMVVQNAPLQKMVEDGRQWWQASIVSSKVEAILNSNAFLEPGECSESWFAVDLLGADLENTVPTANQGLGYVGTEVGHSGIGEMLELAKTVVENMDAVGYWNKGPAATAAPVNPPPAGNRADTDTVAVRQTPEDWRNQALVPWNEEEEYSSGCKW